MRRIARSVLPALAAAALAAGCGGGDDPPPQLEAPAERITVWSLENEPARLRETRADIAEFTRRTRIRVKLVGVGDDELATRISAAERTDTLPDVATLPLASAHEYARQDLLDVDAASDVLDRLGDDTFSQTALTLLSRDGRVVAVPSDGWGQLLVYRRDLLRRAGVPPPATLEAVQAAARRLTAPGRAGIAMATAPREAFTGESFEHIALAFGCRLVDDQGRVTLDSPPCRRAFRWYADTARRYGPRGAQDADTTLREYLAGRAAMLFWSPFLLDAMAGLRDDVVPTCPQCRRDRAYLATHSGLVGAISGGGAPPAQFGELASWGIFRARRREAAVRFVEYMLSDGYLRWLALSPQGKYPVRAGDDRDPERYFRAWEGLRSGTVRRAPLRRYYGEAAVSEVREGVQSFSRWAFPQGQGALAGALRGPQPVSAALAAAIRGDASPAAAATRAQRSVERLQARVR